MVVPEEVNPDNTTTENTKKGTSSPLTLNYDVTPFEILSETEIKDEVNTSKDITIYNENGVESGIEIQYTSMKLKNFPIKDSNISSYEKEIERISLNTTTIYIGETPLLNTNIKIISFNKFKIIEFKTREFKLGLSVKLDNDTIIKDGDFFKYEIFSKLKNSRLISITEIFKRIFSGEEISFKIKDLFGKISFDNPIQTYKFNLIIDSIKKYENIESSLNISKTKIFSETTMSFYTIYLLDNYLSGKTTINSWLNYKIKNNFSATSGDNLIFIKDHNLDFKGIDYFLREKLIVKDSINKKEINTQENSIVGYRKLVEIQLEKIKK